MFFEDRPIARAPRSPRPPRSPRGIALENAAFLRALRRTGNAREAARLTGASRSRFTKRRARDPAFAAGWDAALAWAQAALSARADRGSAERPHKHCAEPYLVRRRDGTVQLRRRPATAITPEGEQRFLLALAATANVRLSARAAGYAHSSFCTRKRRHPAFAREWLAALKQGFEALDMVLLAGWSRDAHEHDAWAHNDPPPMPPMTVDQALQLMYLHQKEARLIAEPEPLRRRRGESPEARDVRLRLIREAWQEQAREEFRAMEAARRAQGLGPYWGGDQPDRHEPSARRCRTWRR